MWLKQGIQVTGNFEGSKGEKQDYHNALLVPSLTRSLISIPRFFKHKLSITKTAEKGASVLIDKDFQLLGSLKNNLLELHSSYFEAMNPQSACYHSIPETINWHGQIGHPNQRYQQLMVLNSEIINCSVCKTCKLKSLPFASKFKRVKELLESIQMDLVGPFSVQSSAGYVYFLMLIDKFSRFRTVKFLRPLPSSLNSNFWKRNKLAVLFACLSPTVGVSFLMRILGICQFPQTCGLAVLSTGTYSGRSGRNNAGIRERLFLILRSQARSKESCTCQGWKILRIHISWSKAREQP
ncbi:hypothetical protein VP01_4552g1 [Puccinia sorghi]|uniref:GAG-pre-integrase domain-containing protein n=1 Tax=Puccinia sorghi TaxID=27349 RepID=A0A0L6UNS9_9BASI|nr:hypothetical protein VP01_4552g1 [Puccinia sorghi]